MGKKWQTSSGALILSDRPGWQIYQLKGSGTMMTPSTTPSRAPPPAPAVTKNSPGNPTKIPAKLPPGVSGGGRQPAPTNRVPADGSNPTSPPGVGTGGAAADTAKTGGNTISPSGGSNAGAGAPGNTGFSGNANGSSGGVPSSGGGRVSTTLEGGSGGTKTTVQSATDGDKEKDNSTVVIIVVAIIVLVLVFIVINVAMHRCMGNGDTNDTADTVLGVTSNEMVYNPLQMSAMNNQLMGNFVSRDVVGAPSGMRNADPDWLGYGVGVGDQPSITYGDPNDAISYGNAEHVLYSYDSTPASNNGYEVGRDDGSETYNRPEDAVLDNSYLEPASNIRESTYLEPANSYLEPASNNRESTYLEPGMDEGYQPDMPDGVSNPLYGAAGRRRSSGPGSTSANTKTNPLYSSAQVMTPPEIEPALKQDNLAAVYHSAESILQNSKPAGRAADPAYAVALTREQQAARSQGHGIIYSPGPKTAADAQRRQQHEDTVKSAYSQATGPREARGSAQTPQQSGSGGAIVPQSYEEWATQGNPGNQGRGQRGKEGPKGPTRTKQDSFRGFTSSNTPAVFAEEAYSGISPDVYESAQPASRGGRPPPNHNKASSFQPPDSLA